MPVWKVTVVAPMPFTNANSPEPLGCFTYASMFGVKSAPLSTVRAVAPPAAAAVVTVRRHWLLARTRPLRIVTESVPGPFVPVRDVNAPSPGRHAPARRRSRVMASRLPRIACCASTRNEWARAPFTCDAKNFTTPTRSVPESAQLTRSSSSEKPRVRASDERREYRLDRMAPAALRPGPADGDHDSLHAGRRGVVRH